MARQIPRKVLPHSATLNSVTGKDIYQNPTTSQTSLRFVRFEDSNKLVQSSTNQERQLVSTLFYDCVNSTPKNVTFQKNDTIEYNGLTFTVLEIDTKYNSDKKHHLELRLI